MTGTARVLRIDPKSRVAAPRERPPKAVLPIVEDGKKTGFSGPYIAKVSLPASRYGIRRPAVVLVSASRRDGSFFGLSGNKNSPQSPRAM